jgi:nucleotide-binding universal stress UspA family protein
MYKTILVPHIGTPEGDIALKHAIDIAKSSLSKIIILHVIEQSPHDPLLGLHSSQVTRIRQQIVEMTRERKDTIEKEMTSQVKLCKSHGIDASLKVTIGLPAEEILKAVKNQKIDLIIMAKRRKLTGLKSLLALGSVSRKIVENTSCPVLMIDIEKKR